MKTKLLLMALAVGLCVAAFAALRLTQPSHSALPQVEDAPFDQRNFSRVQPDTLAALMGRAYGNAMRVELINSAVKLEWNAGSAGSAAAFFNNNEGLLRERRHGFSLAVSGGTLRAEFDVRDGTVNVPNDVLLSVARRLSKTNL